MSQEFLSQSEVDCLLRGVSERPIDNCVSAALDWVRRQIQEQEHIIAEAEQNKKAWQEIYQHLEAKK